MIRFLMAPLPALVLWMAAGCSDVPCDFPVKCLDRCGGSVVSNECGPCAAGTQPVTACCQPGDGSDAGPAGQDGGLCAGQDAGP